jgi:aspartate/methionine/tyrosine aminotransferase
MSFFADSAFRVDLLRKHAWNRWGALADDVIPLTAADPDFQVAPEIREAVKEIGSDGVFSYGESYGNRDFRKVIADTVRARKKMPCSPDDVLVTNGVAQARAREECARSCTMRLINIILIILTPCEMVKHDSTR